VNIGCLAGLSPRQVVLIGTDSLKFYMPPLGSNDFVTATRVFGYYECKVELPLCDSSASTVAARA
jgi:hypothetical protein